MRSYQSLLLWEEFYSCFQCSNFWDPFPIFTTKNRIIKKSQRIHRKINSEDGNKISKFVEPIFRMVEIDEWKKRKLFVVFRLRIITNYEKFEYFICQCHYFNVITLSKLLIRHPTKQRNCILEKSWLLNFQS